MSWLELTQHKHQEWKDLIILMILKMPHQLVIYLKLVTMVEELVTKIMLGMHLVLELHLMRQLSIELITLMTVLQHLLKDLLVVLPEVGGKEWAIKIMDSLVEDIQLHQIQELKELITPMILLLQLNMAIYIKMTDICMQQPVMQIMVGLWVALLVHYQM